MNPILQALGNSRMGQIANLKNMIGGNPNAIYNQMMQNNPQFAQFVNANKGKTPEQIARDYGLDPNILGQILK